MHAVLIIGAAAAAAAAAPDKDAKIAASPVVSAVEACRAIADSAARLACYDRTVGALTAARSRGDIRVVDRVELTQVRRSLFGFGVPKLPFFRSGNRGEADQKNVSAKLVSWRGIGNDLFRFTIDEPDSTWETTEGAYLGDARPGTAVTIERGALTAYFAKVGTEKWVRVRRVR